MKKNHSNSKASPTAEFIFKFFPQNFLSVHSLCPGLIDSLSRIRRLLIPTTTEKYCINIINFALANIIVQWCTPHY